MTSSATADETKLYVDANDAQAFVQGVLVGNGVSSSHAAMVARCLVAADLRGVDTHGMNRIPSYMERIRQGVLDGSATPELKQITPVVTQVDARNGFGFVAADAGMAAAIESAKVCSTPRSDARAAGDADFATLPVRCMGSAWRASSIPTTLA